MKKLAIFIVVIMMVAIVVAWQIVNAQGVDTYRNVIPYPYHAAPYYSYPFTNGYGYQYSPPIVNSEYTDPNNTRQIVVYPEGPYHYENYYKYGTTTCYTKGRALVCTYRQR